MLFRSTVIAEDEEESDRFDIKAWKAIDDALALPAYRSLGSLAISHDLPLSAMPTSYECEDDLLRHLLPRLAGRNILDTCNGRSCKYHSAG